MDDGHRRLSTWRQIASAQDVLRKDENLSIFPLRVDLSDCLTHLRFSLLLGYPAVSHIRGALIYDHPSDFATTIALITSNKLEPGKAAGQFQPLENVATLFEAMINGTLSAKPLVCPHLSLDEI